MRRAPYAAFAGAGLLSAIFVAIACRYLGTLSWEYDEGTFMLAARWLARGQRPFVDFTVHTPPLHLYLLALSAKVFGATVFGYRMLSVLSVAASGLVLFALLRPFVGPRPALVAQAVFLFSPSQMHALNAVAEGPMVLLTLVGAACLFLGRGRWSATASGVAFVAALLVKPTCLVMVLAAAGSLVLARAWRRLWDFALAGTLAAVAGLGWTFALSDGIFADILRYTVQRVGARSGGLWTIESGFPELLRLLGIHTRGEWTAFCFRNYYYFPEYHLPMVLFALAFAGIPVWLWRARPATPALRAFAVLWPAAYLLTNLVALDYVSAKYFVPFLAFSAFLLAAPLAELDRRVPPLVASIGGVAIAAGLMVQLATSLERQDDPWYYGRAEWIAHDTPHVVAFTPMFFAATGIDPGCDFWNPADTYGAFGEAILGASERTRRYQVPDAQLVACLRAHPDMRLVVDFWYYFLTRPGSAMREYLHGDGRDRIVFFSRQALAQWEGGVIANGAVAR